METKHTLLAIFGSALFGAFCSAAVISTLNDEPGGSNTDTETLNTRIGHLEQRLEEAQTATQQVQEVIARLSRPDLAITDNTVQSVSEEQLDAEFDAVEDVQAPLSSEQRRANIIERFQPQYRKRSLVAAGFTEDEAQWVIDTEAEVQLKQLYDQYDQRRKALEQAVESGQQPTSGRADLRAKLGDEMFERYLQANGQTISVTVGGVMQASPGDNAGLQPGDNIIAYDGQRVFEVRDLNQLTIQGTRGESVLLEIERNGNPTQLTIPRGPIGVTATRGRLVR